MMNTREFTLSVEEFAPCCLQLIDSISKAEHGITLTKDGRPLARLVPIPPEPMHRTPAELYGFLKGMATIHGDIVSPLDLEWDAEK